MVIKTLNIENPFANYGNIIEGDNFIGREYAIKAIHNRVLGANFGNLAIMGLPRIGKSSLAWNALMTIKSELVAKKILVERINIGSIKNSKDFYLKLIDKTLPNVKSLSFELYNQLSEARKAYYESTNDTEIEFFYALIKQSGYRQIYILDEFDTISNFFTAEDFQFLRELSINPETKICLITLSRQSIEEIEIKSFGGSTFHQVFAYYHLGVYTKSDISKYWENQTLKGLVFSEEYKNQINYLVGNHPFLIDLYNFNFFNALNSSNGTYSIELFDNTKSDLNLNLFSSFESSLNLIKEENLYSKAFQIVLGPVYDVNSIELLKLEKYQFIHEIPLLEKEILLDRNIGLRKKEKDIETSYICFSRYFTEYWNLKFSEADFWPLWKETERELREIVKEYLYVTFGDDWETGYLTKFAGSQNRIDGVQNLKRTMQSNVKKFGNLSSSNIIDHSLTRELFNLFILSDWKWFEPILGDDSKKWAVKFELLADIRNPFAHNNSEFVSMEKLNLAKVYCELIINKINNWRSNK